MMTTKIMRCLHTTQVPCFKYLIIMVHLRTSYINCSYY